jgi:NAD(P)-dependent dehydrogenase (short-subunit alcohol dehydrogenase family)
MSEQTNGSSDAGSGVALITGSSRGLGFALAQALAQQGWTLIVVGWR